MKNASVSFISSGLWYKSYRLSQPELLLYNGH